MKLEFFPSKPKGEVKAPPSKSMAHRLLICSALAKGRSVIRGVEYSEDILATLDCIEVLGAKVRREGGTVYINGIKKMNSPARLDCRESGSTLRFLIPVSVTSSNLVSFFGKGKLMQRPMEEYEKLLPAHGVSFERNSERSCVEGKLESGEYVLDGDVSSQFVSGLLFALPMLEKDSTVVFRKKVESRPYIDMTIQCLRQYGIDVGWNENGIFVKSGEYIAQNTAVEGDWSNAAFFFALGDGIKVSGLDENSLQGDRVFKKLYDDMKTKKINADISDCPDLGPVLFVCAAMNHGAVFTGTRRLKDKESDRIECMKTELEKCGVKMTVKDNEVEVFKSAIKAPADPICCHNDHRIAMAMSVLLSKTGGKIAGCECVKKSMPDFYERLKKLNVRFEGYEA